jgi:hypothetical protein
MGFSPGEESRSAAVAAQAIEAKPSCGQIRQREARWSRAGQLRQEETWPRSVFARKKPDSPGEGKESLA